MPLDDAIAAIKRATAAAYGKRGDAVIARNLDAIDRALTGLRQVTVPDEVPVTVSDRTTAVRCRVRVRANRDGDPPRRPR